MSDTNGHTESPVFNALDSLISTRFAELEAKLEKRITDESVQTFTANSREQASQIEAALAMDSPVVVNLLQGIAAVINTRLVTNESLASLRTELTALIQDVAAKSIAKGVAKAQQWQAGRRVRIRHADGSESYIEDVSNSNGHVRSEAEDLALPYGNTSAG
jgi:hypothetical protein